MIQCELLSEFRQLSCQSLDDIARKTNTSAELLMQAEKGSAVVPIRVLDFYAEVVGVKSRYIKVFFKESRGQNATLNSVVRGFSKILLIYLKLSKWMCSFDESKKEVRD